MDIKSYRLRDLPPLCWTVWGEMHAANPELASPFFHPDFARAVARARGDAEVGVCFDAAQPRAFFPFHRGPMGIARPLGGHLSDFQGVIASPGVRCDLADVLRGCKLAGWDFDHALASTEGMGVRVDHKAASPFIDISQGFRAYEDERKSQGSKVVKHIEALARKLAREVGPVRIDFHRPEPALLEKMLAWKREQYKKTNVGDVFADGWTVTFLTDLLQHQPTTFGGVFSALWAGERLVAAHMGMRSESVLHYWFPAYDPQYWRYSPGMVLILEMMHVADAFRIKRIDLGKGDADYKTRLMTGATAVLEGSIMVSGPARWARNCWHAAKEILRRSPARWVLRPPLRLAQRWMKKWGFT